MSDGTSVSTATIQRSAATPRELNHRSIEVACTVATLVLLLVSWAGERAGWPARTILGLNILSYITGGWFGVRAAARAILRGRLNIDFLMVIAAIGAALIDQWHDGATLLFLFSLSNTLQEFAMERARNAISRLMKLRPIEAAVLRGGVEVRVAVESLRTGDVVLVRPGEMVAADGVIVNGMSDLNQASITGESVPIEKGAGEKVFAGTLNGAGALEIEVSRTASDSTLARIIQLVETAQGQKARTQRFLDAFEGYYAGFVVTASMLAIVVPWLLMKHEFAPTFYRAMVLLVVASPCALIISTPASILSAIANGARRGVLFKGGAHLESLAEIAVVAFDKTGTLTRGRLRVTDIFPAGGAPEGFGSDELLATAAALESRSEHPIARAVVAAAKTKGLALPELSDFKNLAGRGIHARTDGYLVWIGGSRMFDEHGENVPSELDDEKRRLEREGKTVLILHRELSRNDDVGRHEQTGGWLGLIAVADTVRPEARETISRLKEMGVQRTVMLTGDNRDVAATIASELGVDEYLAELLPEEKVGAIKRLRDRYGPVLMVGDGVNDAPALAVANVGAAMGAAGSDVALETADLVLMSDDLSKIPYALMLARRSRRIVWQNITFALLVIVGLVVATFGFGLKLPFGVIGHEGSTLVVVANGLRLLATRPA